MRKVSKISIHCSSTITGSAKAFRRYHMNVKGWSDIGYHYVINNGRGRSTTNGEIEDGRPLSRMPAAVYGHNSGSIAICLVGARNKDFTVEQMDSLQLLLESLVEEFNIPKENILGHRDYSTKERPIYKKCPCFDVKTFVKQRM